MSHYTIHACDICKKETSFFFDTYLIRDPNGPTGEKIDMCNRCWKRMKKWIKSNKETL